jgi:iron(III) transport system substrate-binding protein
MNTVAAAIFILSFLSLDQFGFTATKDEIIQAAKQEGEIVFYASLGLEDANSLINQFTKQYPFLKVRQNRLETERLLTKYLMEAGAGKYLADVVQTFAFSMHTFTKKGLLSQYISPEAQFYPEGFKAEGYWTTAYAQPYVVAYNTKTVPSPQLPKTYGDLLNPFWKGNMMMEGTKIDWLAGMLQIMGKEKGIDYMRKLAKQDLNLRAGHTIMLQMIAAGESLVDVNVPITSVERAKRNGAPLDWLALGPVPSVLVGIGVSGKPQHPNAAKLFVDFVLSKQGQRTVLGFNRVPVRPDMRVELTPQLKALDMIPVSPALADNINEYATLLKSIFAQ